MTDGPLSPRNPRVASARRLSKRSLRSQAREFLVEGPQAVREALGVADLVRQVFVTGDAERRHAALLSQARRQGAQVDHVSATVIAELAETVTPQGVVAVCGYVDVGLEELVGENPPTLVAVLAQVRDPGNAGTVIRVADAAGAGGVVLTEASVDPYNGKCVRASAGSLFHLPVVIGAPVADALAGLRAAGLRLIAAHGGGEVDLDAEIDSGRLAAPTAWVFGNEAWGLPESTLSDCDAVVRVPIHGRAESLNLATAAAVCLYASARAQR